MNRRRHHKQDRQRRTEWMIRQEIARAEQLLDENNEAMRVLTKALDNEPKGLAKAFAEIEQKGAGK
jgi:metal-responsive CopG/Arc/MetJ family transcriptional regulator